MRNLLVISGLLVTACGGAQVSSPVSAGDHKAVSRARSPGALAADREEHGPVAYYSCGDPVLSDQATSGGERLTPTSPCWAANFGREQARADKLDSAAQARRGADTLPSCNSLTTDELAQGQSCTQGILVR